MPRLTDTQFDVLRLIAEGRNLGDYVPRYRPGARRGTGAFPVTIASRAAAQLAQMGLVARGPSESGYVLTQAGAELAIASAQEAEAPARWTIWRNEWSGRVWVRRDGVAFRDFGSIEAAYDWAERHGVTIERVEGRGPSVVEAARRRRPDPRRDPGMFIEHRSGYRPTTPETVLDDLRDVMRRGGYIANIWQDGRVVAYAFRHRDGRVTIRWE